VTQSSRARLRAALSERLVPALLSRGFEGPQTITGNALLHEYRRRTTHGWHVLSVQLEKRGLPRFLLLFHTELLEGLERVIAHGGTVITGRLTPNPGTGSSSWFRADRPWWQRLILRRRDTLETETVERCIAMLKEVDAWWSNPVASDHIRVWPVNYPGNRSNPH